MASVQVVGHQLHPEEIRHTDFNPGLDIATRTHSNKSTRVFLGRAERTSTQESGTTPKTSSCRGQHAIPRGYYMIPAKEVRWRNPEKSEIDA